MSLTHGAGGEGVTMGWLALAGLLCSSISEQICCYRSWLACKSCCNCWMRAYWLLSCCLIRLFSFVSVMHLFSSSISVLSVIPCPASSSSEPDPYSPLKGSSNPLGLHLCVAVCANIYSWSSSSPSDACSSR